MRFTAFCAAGLTAVALSACGGGGNSGASTTPATQQSAAPTGPAQSQTVTNFTGPATKLSVSIAIPQRTQLGKAARQALHKRLGSYTKGATARAMYNTSPTAQIRAAGLQQNRYAAQVDGITPGTKTQSGSRKTPQFVSPSTYSLEFVLTDSSNNVLVDSWISSCSSSSCTGTFNVPIGSGYNAIVYLYDDCDYLLGAGESTNLTLGVTNSPLTLTVNGVVYTFSVSNDNSTTLYDDPSSASSIDVTMVPVDYDYNVISHQGGDTSSVLLDTNLNQITGVTLSVDAADVTPASTPLTVQPDLSIPQATFSFAGTGSESSINWSATPVTGSQVVPLLYTGYSVGSTTGGTSVAVSLPTLQWTNPNGYPLAAGDPQFSVQGNGNPSYANFEFPQPNNTQTVTLGLTENLPNFNGNITLTDNGNCGGIISAYTPILGTYAYSVLSASPYVQFQMGSSGASSSCVVTATDDATNPRSAQVTIYTDSTSLTIQNAARKH